jgi:hypothetical protein
VDEMIFESLDLIRVPVRIGAQQYVLREADEAAAVAYRNAVMKAVRMTEGGPTTLDGAADVEPLLVSRCLFTANEAGGLTPVPLAVIRTWPSRIVKPLFARAKAISELEEGEDTAEQLQAKIDKLQARLDKLQAGESAAKNGGASTPGTSS